MLFDIDKSIIFNGLNLTEITPDNVRVLDRFYSRVRPDKMTSAALCGNLLYGLKNFYTIVDGYLVLTKVFNGKMSLITFPFNEHGFMPMSKTMDFMAQHDIVRVISVLDSYFKNRDIEPLKKRFDVKKIETEYVFSVEALYNLDGSSFRRVRKGCRRFEKDYPNVSFRVCTPDDRNMVSAVYDMWTELRKNRYKNNFWDGKHIYKMFDFSPETCLLFFDGEVPIGLIESVVINDRMVQCVARKVNIRYANISKFVEHEYAIWLHDNGYIYEHRDTASGELVEFKDSFCPINKSIRYEIILRR